MQIHHRCAPQYAVLAAILAATTWACPADPPGPDATPSDTSRDTGIDGVATDDGGSDLSEEVVIAVGDQDQLLRLNHLQSLGTHNSYHLRSDPVIHESHDYAHLPLDAQLDMGVRAFEIDIHNPEDLVGPDDFAVYHITFLDEATTCLSLRACLGLIVGWSDAHPMHVPIAIWVEPKGDAGGGTITDLPRLDEVIKDVVATDKLITPATVRGQSASVRAALEETGWPTLGDARGKLLFALLDTEEARDVYTEGMTVIQERVVFVGAKPSEFAEPWAAVAKINNPASTAINDAHAASVLVASNLCLAGEPDASDCAAGTAAAEVNGSHWLKTDFPSSEGAPYSLNLPPRCNPATAPAPCVSQAIE